MSYGRTRKQAKLDEENTFDDIIKRGPSKSAKWHMQRKAYTTCSYREERKRLINIVAWQNFTRKESKEVEQMGNVRPINEKKYDISKHRFLELYHFCMQYNEWKDELKYKTDTVKSIEVTDMPTSRGSGNATASLAIRRAELQKKCELIEQTAIEADPDIYQYIIKGVTTDYATYKYLSQVLGMPCGKDMYYNRRRKFYWLLSNKI